MVCVSNIEVHTKGGLRMSVFGITLLSIKRRMPQIIKAACTTLAAVFCDSGSYISGEYVPVADVV